MAAPDPTTGAPVVLDSEAPATAVNLNAASNYAASVGTRLIGTTAQRTAYAYARDGLRWFDTTTDLEYRHNGTGWVIPSPPHCTVRRTTAQSIGTGVFTTITFTAEVSDLSNMWVSGSPSRVTVPAAGLYLVIGGGGVVASGGGRVAARLLRNGAEHPVGGSLVPTNSQDNAGASVQAIVPCNAGDYFELGLFQDSGSSKNVGSTDGYAAPYLSVALIQG